MAEDIKTEQAQKILKNRKFALFNFVCSKGPISIVADTNHRVDELI